MTERPALRLATSIVLTLGFLAIGVHPSAAQSTAPKPATPAATAPATLAPAPVAPAVPPAPSAPVTATTAPNAATPGISVPGTPIAASGTLPAAAPAPLADLSLPADLSITALIAHADRVVKGVMILLAVASVLSWTIMLAKGLELLFAGRAVRRGLRFAETDAPDGTPGMPRPLLLMRRAVRAELAASEGAEADGTKDRLASRLKRIEMRIARQAQRGTGLLATIGAVGPFVGLFGTVWGIMNSFIGIAKLHTTNLAVVAPGIAEALLATAAGLVAAIPAVVIYNLFARWIGAYRAGLGDLGEIVLRHAARALDMARPEAQHRRRMAAE